MARTRRRSFDFRRRRAAAQPTTTQLAAVVGPQPPPQAGLHLASDTAMQQREREVACQVVDQVPIRDLPAPGQPQRSFNPRQQRMVNWLTDVAYWRVYAVAGVCPVTIPSAAHGCAANWLRIREAVRDCRKQRGVTMKDLLERAVAQLEVEKNPNKEIDATTHLAYRQAYPRGPDYPDFYDASQEKWIYAWVRIRNWVDYFKNRTTGPVRTAGVRPYSEPRPLKSLGVPIEFGGDPSPIWPVRSTDYRGCDVNYLDAHGVMHGLPFQRFGAPRGSSDWETKPSRYHIGHDCLANGGDIVVAPEDAVVGNIRDFYSGTKAMYLWTDTGLTLNLGEIEPGSQHEFGATIGARVTKGQPVARVGTFELEDELPYNMIHFEIFEGHRDRSLNWYSDEPRPTDLRNPTDYLLRAACSVHNRFTTVGGFTAPAAPTERPLSQLRELGRFAMANASPNFRH